MSRQRLRLTPEFPWWCTTGLQLDGAMTTIQIEAPDGPIDALLDMPEGKGPWPGVVVIHDAIGYPPDKESINDQVAQGGYLALTPNLFARGGRRRCVTRAVPTVCCGTY